MPLGRTMSMLAALLGCAIANGGWAQPAPADRALDVTGRSGVMQRVLWTAPPHPRATIVMLPGGTGNIGIERGGGLRRGHNFVVRTRALWNARGYAVLIPDTVSGRSLRGARSALGYADVVADLVRFAHAQAGTPVFLLGTSQGAIAAMNGAAHAAPASIRGLVLSESVSVMGGSGETVFDADPDKVRAPALVVANRDDRCPVAPPANAPKIAAAMTASPDVRVLFVAGGHAHGDDPCASLSAHGYYGIEAKVVGDIADWMDARLKAGRAGR